MRPALVTAAALLGIALAARAGGTQAAAAPADTSITVAFSAFLDTYYAWDAQRPASLDRAYTTQPARYAEFNVNLAYADVRLTGPRLRGRLALQAGTSVQANYAGEPRVGTVSGPSVSQFIQEATVGYRVSHALWIDAGIFFSHIGTEGFISRDNLTYTRSLVSDYTPFYESGVKATWSPSTAVTAQLVVVNGWQNVSAENREPAAGLRVDVTLSPSLTVSYDDFIGNIAPDTAPSNVRFFNELIVLYAPSAAWRLAVSVDVGRQTADATGSRTATWTGGSVILRRRLDDRVAVVGRIERLADPDQAIVQTALALPFETNSASLGIDVALTSRLLWRSELRGYSSSHRVWPTHDTNRFASRDAVGVMSLALTI